MEKGGIVCAQILLTIFNVIQFVFGCWIIIACSVALANSTSTAEDTGVVGAAIFVIGISFILVVISIIGCIGAWKKNFWMLVTFASLTSFIFILMVIVVILLFAWTAKTPELEENLLMLFITGNDTDPMESIQNQWKCCGVRGPSDWKLNQKYSDGVYLPQSCCETPECSVLNPTHYKMGCKDVGLLAHSLLVMRVITSLCAVAMFVAIFAASCLASSVRTSYQAV